MRRRCRIAAGQDAGRNAVPGIFHGVGRLMIAKGMKAAQIAAIFGQTAVMSRILSRLCQDMVKVWLSRYPLSSTVLRNGWNCCGIPFPLWSLIIDATRLSLRPYRCRPMWNPCSSNFSLQFLSSQPPAKMRRFLLSGFIPGEATHKRIGKWHGNCGYPVNFFLVMSTEFPVHSFPLLHPSPRVSLLRQHPLQPNKKIADTTKPLARAGRKAHRVSSRQPGCRNI